MSSPTPRVPGNHRVVWDAMGLPGMPNNVSFLYWTLGTFFTNLGLSALLQKLEVCFLSQKVKAKNPVL